MPRSLKTLLYCAIIFFLTGCLTSQQPGLQSQNNATLSHAPSPPNPAPQLNPPPTTQPSRDAEESHPSKWRKKNPRRYA